MEEDHWENIVVDGWLSGLSQALPKLPPYAIYYDYYDFAAAEDTQKQKWRRILSLGPGLLTIFEFWGPLHPFFEFCVRGNCPWAGQS